MKALALQSQQRTHRLALVIVVLVLLALPLLVYVAYGDAVVNWAVLDTGTGASALAIAKDSPATLNDRVELASGVTGGKASGPRDASANNLASVVTATESITITYTIDPPAADGSNGWYRNAATVYWSWTGNMLRTAATSSAPCGPTPIPNQPATPMECLGVKTDPVKRDGSPPNPPKVTAKYPDGSAYPDGQWTKQNVTVVFEQQGDNGPSGIAFCNPTSMPINQDQNAPVSGNCTDNAGNIGGLGSITVRRDTTGPYTDPTTDATPHDGWYMPAVNVLWNWKDLGIGIDSVRCTTTKTPVTAALGEGPITLPTATQTITCYDKLGNMGKAAPITVKMDRSAPYYTPPTTAKSNNATYNLGNWTNSPVTVSFTCYDKYSGPVDAAPGVTTTTVISVTNKEGENQTVYGLASQCVDKVGWQSTSAASYGSIYNGVNIDLTKPVISHTLSPKPNDYLWNRTPVTVTFTCAETGAVQSGIVANSVAGKVVSTEGANQQVTNTGTCGDRAGNTAVPDSVKVNIDWTPPEITPLQPPGSYLIGCGTKPQFDVVDNLSGLVRPPEVSGPVPTVSDDGMLVDRYTVTAEDKAGNAVTKHFDYLVYKTDDPFWLPPVNADGTSLFNLGKTVPIKFELYDCNNQPVKDADARLKVVWRGPALPQGPTPPQEPNAETNVGSGDSGNKFRRTGEYYQYNWSTKGLWVGKYEISVMIGGLPLRSVNIGLR